MKEKRAGQTRGPLCISYATPRRPAPRRARGVTLVELVVAMAVLSVALMGLMSTILSSSTLQQNTREKAVAYNHARRLLEEMRSVDFREVYARYNSTTGDNPAGGASPGSVFTVAGLIPPHSGNPVGEIIFPESGPGILSETVNNPSMGMPKDLNRDGDALDTDVSATYKILPVKIVIRWRSVGGADTQIEVDSFITEK